MKQCIVFISPSSLSMMNACAITYAKSLGYETTVVVDEDYKLLLNVDYVIHTDTSNASIVITDLAEFALSHIIKGILTYSDYHVEITALLNEYFGLNGASYTAVLKCKNKFLCRMTMDSVKWKQPEYRLVKDKTSFMKAIEDIGIPLVIKPMDGLGSMYTSVIENTDRIVEKFENLCREKRESSLGKEKIISDRWIVEEGLEGFQISVESYTYNCITSVVCIHDKLNPIEPPLFRVFYSETPSSRIDDKLEKKIIERVKMAIEAIGFDNGIAHTEFRISKSGKIQLLEINARTGGGLIIPSAFYSTGINLYTVAIDIALNHEPNVVRNMSKRPVVFRVVYPESDGRLVKFRGIDKNCDNKNFQIIEKASKEGDIVGKGQRLALILKQAKEDENVDELIKEIDIFVSQLDVQIETVDEKIPLPKHINNSSHY